MNDEDVELGYIVKKAEIQLTKKAATNRIRYTKCMPCSLEYLYSGTKRNVS
jgi:hypothetical protein